jgi:hypothetical protein
MAEVGAGKRRLFELEIAAVAVALVWGERPTCQCTLAKFDMFDSYFLTVPASKPTDHGLFHFESFLYREESELPCLTF